MGKTSRVAFPNIVSVCGNSVVTLWFFSKAVPQVSQAFKTQIILCENGLKKKKSVGGYGVSYYRHQKTEGCEPARKCVLVREGVHLRE